ncbi:MAG TPA: hypothetical protein VKA21_05380 [Candidatus Binatia bacterium]|nr:hypothetical protein [Candidatus Binatia bacterium]
MASEILRAKRDDGRSARFLLEVVEQGDHWTSTVARLDEHGIPESGQIAPRFYGLTREQARRRMIAALENDWDDVEPEGRGVEQG